MLQHIINFSASTRQIIHINVLESASKYALVVVIPIDVEVEILVVEVVVVVVIVVVVIAPTVDSLKKALALYKIAKQWNFGCESMGKAGEASWG